MNVLKKHSPRLTQYDMLEILVMLVVAYIDTVTIYDRIPRDTITDAIIKLIQENVQLIPKRNVSDKSSDDTVDKGENKEQ